MPLSRSVRDRAVDGDASRVFGAAGHVASLFEQLEARVVLAADWSDAVTPDLAFGPEYRPERGVEMVGWRGGSVEMRENSWILSFGGKLGAGAVERAVESAGSAVGAGVESWEILAGGRYAVVDFDRMPPESSIEALPDLVAEITAVDPNAIYQVNQLPNDPLFPEQQWLDNTGQFVVDDFGWFVGNGVIGADISAPEAWDITTGSRDVIVGVVDSGLDMDHPDIVANIWRNPGEIAGNELDDDGNGFIDDVNGWDFGEGDNNPDDALDHGTGAAGMIGAVGNNGIGVSGTAWDVSIIPLKVADRFGNLVLSAIISSHDYLTMMIEDFGHNIVASNNSYRGLQEAFYSDAPEGFDAEKDAIQRFIEAGATFVASAGNDALDNDNDDVRAFPASYNLPGLISVAATNPDDTLALYSNYGAETVDLAAPGVGVLTIGMGGVYQHFGGTSAAGPVVVGAVALLKTFRPEASAVEVRQALIDGVDQLPALQGRVVSGGRLNMARSLQIIGTDGPVAIGFTPGPITSRTDPDTGLPIDTITVTFNKDIDPSTLDASAAQLTYAGSDGELGTGDDSSTLVPIVSVEVRAGEANVVDIALDLTGVPQQRLPLGLYRLTLFPGTAADPKFQDVDGNLLNGDSSGGDEEEYDFQVVGVGGNLEPNDTLVSASPVTFNGSGRAAYRSMTLGDGLNASLDVDLYAINLPRGGLITAEITAQRLALPSTLDSYLRLFDGEGNELASNDQFYGRDSLLDFFVTTGGTYYIGVSGFPNSDYDPEVAGSGRTQSTGVYDIELEYQRIADDRHTVASDLETPLPIPAEGTQGTQSTTLTVTDARQIKDLNLRLDIDHNFVSDLEITLIAPDGTEQVVFNQHGTDGDDFEGVLLDDEAATSIEDATPPYTGSLRPTNGLNRFDGKSALGTWTLLIRDRRALNSGQLNSWALEFTLENDIFGPFESNDTISTARTLTGIFGTGAATVEAVIGDGGFGTLDRDIYQITVDAGATLNATATSIGADDGAETLDTALRLFDAEGNEIKAASPAGSLHSSITGFVFPAGGVYYIAVSEGANLDYDPFDVTSGTPLVTTGDYSLSVTVSPGISDDQTVAEGEQIDVGVDSDGTFGTADENGTPVGLVFEGTDFLLDTETGSGLESLYSLTASGYDFMNDGSRGPTALPVSLTNQSDPFNNRVTASGLFRGIQVERTLTYGVSDSFLAFDVVLTNTSEDDATNVSWLEAFDPNQGLNLDDRGPSTSNDVDSAGKYASASVSTNAFPEGLTIALAAPASDSRAFATFIDPDSLVLRDPSQVLAIGSVDPDGASDDLLMALAYDIGTIASGDAVSLRYFVFLGASPSAAQAPYNELNAGTGEGHLTIDPAAPASEELSNGETAPTLANRYYYPAGFSSPFIYSFVPMINPHDAPTRVVVIARYEVGSRDDVIADFTIEPQARGGITVNTPEMYNIGFGNEGGSLVRPDEPYALEIRAERPIAATFSYFDTFLLEGERAAVGESFTATTSETWTFSSVGKAPGRFDFPVYMNTTAETIKVTTTLLPTGGGDEIVLTQELGPHRRGGWNLSALEQVPEGTYGMVIQAQGAIVASHQSYDSGLSSGDISAVGAIGLPNLGSTTGVTPEGEIGRNSDREIVGVTNANEISTRVTFSFIFEGGSAYRTVLDVPARSRGELNVGELPGFPEGQPYSISYSSELPVALSLPTLIFSDGAGTMFTDQAYTLWAFGAGFRPQNGHEEAVTEYLRLFNPSDEAVVVEITIRFDGNFDGTNEPLGQETFRRVLEPRRVSEFDVHDFVTGARREQDVFYGLTVKAADPIVAYLGRFDAFFPGAFGTLGVPLGITGSI